MKRTTVKTHKRVSKNKVSVVRSHSRSTAAGNGVKYNPNQFAGSTKKKVRKVSTSKGAKKFLFNAARDVIHKTGKARQPQYTKGKSFTPNTKQRPSIKNTVKKVFKSSIFSIKSTSNTGRIKGRNVAAKMLGRKVKPIKPIKPINKK